jgi:hypothetical protein
MENDISKKKSLSKKDMFNDVFQRNYRPFIWLAVIGFLAYIRTLWFGYSPLDDFTLVVKRLDWLRDINHFPNIFSKGIFYRRYLCA